MAKSFLPTQVRISQSACACRSREEQVMHRWPQAVVRWAIGGGVWQKVCAVSKALTRVFFLCWISSHGWRKLEDNGQMIPSPQSLFHCFYSLRLLAHCGRSLHAWGAILTLLLLLSLFFFNFVFIMFWLTCMQVTRSLLIQGSRLSFRLLPYGLVSLWLHLVFTWGNDSLFPGTTGNRGNGEHASQV